MQDEVEHVEHVIRNPPPRCDELESFHTYNTLYTFPRRTSCSVLIGTDPIQWLRYAKLAKHDFKLDFPYSNLKLHDKPPPS